MKKMKIEHSIEHLNDLMIFYENDQNLAKLKNSKNQDFSKIPFRF